MKEVLFKKECIKYENSKYKDYSPIEYVAKEENNLHDFGFLVPVFPPTEKHPLFLHESTDFTEESFSENFINPMWGLSKYYNMVVVEKDEDKVSIKTFRVCSHRRRGKKWFKITKNMDFITVNTKTGDVYVGYVQNYHLKRKCRKRVRRNYFLHQPLSVMMSNIKNTIRCDDNITIHIDAISTFMNQVDGSDSFDNLNFSQRLFKFYLNKRGIKIPNNFYVFNDFWYGPEIRKATKKRDNKMIDGVMSHYELTGNQFKKALHNCEYFNFNLCKNAMTLFGKDWISQDYNLILACLNSKDDIMLPPDEFYNYVTKEELKRIFEIFKQVIVDKTLNSYTFNDHIRMYTELKRYGETDLRWMSSNNGKIGFREEHLNWSDKIEFYRNGTYTRIYPEYSYEFIQKPITYLGDIYYPVLLNRSDNYNQESSIQSNCVKTYVGKSSSIIISLRKNDVNSDERATIEYKLSKKLDDVCIERVQSLGRFNGKLSDEWNGALFSLDEMMLSYINDKNFDTVKIIKECKNGHVFESNSIWGENGRLIWDKQKTNHVRLYLDNTYF